MKRIVLFLFILILLASCQQVPATPQPTTALASTPTGLARGTPTLTPTSTVTLTPTPTPMGGGTLLVAFVATSGCSTGTPTCLVIGDFFRAQIISQTPLQSEEHTSFYWSPDGSSILYSEAANGYLQLRRLDVNSGETTLLSIHALSSIQGQTHLQAFTEVSPYAGIIIHTDYRASGLVDNFLTEVRWSDDGQYVYYQTFYSSLDQEAYVVKMVDRTETTVAGVEGPTTWIPGTHTLVNFGRRAAIDLDTGSETPLDVYLLYKAWIDDGMLFFLTGQDIYYPKQLNMAPLPAHPTDLETWDLQALLANRVVLAQLDPQLNTAAFGQRDTRVIFLDDRVLLSGFVSYNNQTEQSAYTILADVTSLPVTIGRSNLNNERLLTVSPDQAWYMTIVTLEVGSIRTPTPTLAGTIRPTLTLAPSATFPPIEGNTPTPQGTRQSTPTPTYQPPIMRLRIRSLQSGQEIIAEYDLSQFPGMETASWHALDRLEFHWQP